jgi:hypothetical protein
MSNSADDYLKVHNQGPHHADVTEGSGGIWKILHYDLNSPRVVLTSVDSSVWGGRSGYTYDLSRHPDRTTEVDVVVAREGKNLKGRLLGLVLGTVGKGVLAKARGVTVKAIEAGNAGAKMAEKS